MDRQTDEDRWMKSDDQTDGGGQTDMDRRYWTDRKDGNSRQTDGQSLKYTDSRLETERHMDRAKRSQEETKTEPGWGQCEAAGPCACQPSLARRRGVQWGTGGEADGL